MITSNVEGLSKVLIYMIDWKRRRDGKIWKEDFDGNQGDLSKTSVYRNGWRDK